MPTAASERVPSRAQRWQRGPVSKSKQAGKPWDDDGMVHGKSEQEQVKEVGWSEAHLFGCHAALGSAAIIGARAASGRRGLTAL